MSGIIAFYTLLVLLDIAIGIFNFTMELYVLGAIWFVQAAAWLYVEIVLCEGIKNIDDEEALN